MLKKLLPEVIALNMYSDSFVFHCRISGHIEPSCFETVKKVASTGKVSKFV